MNCEAIVDRRPTDWGFVPVTCRQTVSVRTFVERGGVIHAYCAIAGHERDVRRRFVEAADDEAQREAHQERHVGDLADPDCRHCEAAYDRGQLERIR